MAGFQTLVVTDANSAIGKAMQFAPDVIIVNENLRGLSGKDLLVALTSQGIETPVIMLAPRGSEMEIIQAFRLGATDYLLWPVREAEVINAVERVLKQVRDRRERERLTLQLQQINSELQQRARELTTIFAVGKAVISITDVNILFKNILEGAARVTQADLGWLMLRDDATKNFVLAAVHNLPASLPVEINKPWDDGISGLVAMSGESLSIYGEPIRRFKTRLAGSIRPGSTDQSPTQGDRHHGGDAEPVAACSKDQSRTWWRLWQIIYRSIWSMFAFSKSSRTVRVTCR